MATSTQYNPQADLNAKLLAAGASKTVYALVGVEIEDAKRQLLGDDLEITRERYLSQFREAWTSKQDQYHEIFFATWHAWAEPLVQLDRHIFPYYYPTAGASEPLRQVIFDYGNIARIKGFTPRIHVFAGEYEGYKAMAEAAYIEVVEHFRGDWEEVAETLPADELFFLSQPSAIDGNVWTDCNRFLDALSQKSQQPRVVMDLTYIGAIQDKKWERFNMNQHCVRNVVFSLSKPFGAYYDRIGGMFSRKEDLGLFGNKWFKNLTSLSLGILLMESFNVFSIPERYSKYQGQQCERLRYTLQTPASFDFNPADIFILANAESNADDLMANYLRRGNNLLRVCLTPGMAKLAAK